MMVFVLNNRHFVTSLYIVFIEGVNVPVKCFYECVFVSGLLKCHLTISSDFNRVMM